MKKTIITSGIVISIMLLSFGVYGHFTMFQENQISVVASEKVEKEVYYGTDSDLTVFLEQGEKGTQKNPYVVVEVVPYEGFAKIGYSITGCEPVELNELHLGEEDATTISKITAIPYSLETIYKFSLNDGEEEVVTDIYDSYLVSDTANDVIVEGNTIDDSIIDDTSNNDDTSSSDDTNSGDKNDTIPQEVKDKSPINIEDLIEVNRWLLVKDDTKKEYGYYEKVESEKGNYVQKIEEIDGNKVISYVKQELGELIWVADETSSGKDTIHTIEKVGDKVHTYQEKNYYVSKKVVFHNENTFVKDVLRISDSENYYKDSNGKEQPYNIKVVTITPNVLNTAAGLKQLNRADMVYISWDNTLEKATNNACLNLWEQTHKEKVVDKYKTNLYESDLSWNVVVEALKKAVISEDRAIFLYDVPNNLETIASSDSTIKNSNNYKLFYLMQQTNSIRWYNKFIVSTYKNATNVTYDQVVNIGAYGLNSDIKSDTNGNSNVYTVNLRNSFLRYTGSNILSDLKQEIIAKTNYHLGAFEYFSNLDNKTYSKLSIANVLYYLSNTKDIYYEKDKISILEVSPCNEFVSSYDDLLPNYNGTLSVTQMSTAEFIGKIEDINATYDMVYMTLKDGTLNKVDGKTAYNNSALNGKVYLHNGDTIVTTKQGRGSGDNYQTIVNQLKSVSSGNWTTYKGTANRKLDTYTYSGNDITLVKLKELLDYVNSGSPLVLEKDFYTNNVINTVKVDNKSNVYQLLTYKKDNMYLTDTIQSVRFEYNIGRQKPSIEFGKVGEVSSNLEEYYPKVYKDLTLSSNSALTEKDAFINVPNTTNRTLQYKFYIKDQGVLNRKYTVKLYIDINADGRYDRVTEEVTNLYVQNEDGKIIKYNQLKSNTNYTILRNLEYEYNGVLPWLLEITVDGNSSVRYSVQNYCAIKVEEKNRIKLNILQIKMDSNNTVDLQSHTLFKKYTENLKDYEVNFMGRTVNQLSTLLGTDTSKYKYIFTDRDDNILENKQIKSPIAGFDDDGDGFYDIDMIILGFGDMYTDIYNANLLQNIQDFVDEGKSILFTHDTTSFVNLSQNEYKDQTGLSDFWGYNLNKFLRNSIGMDRFGVTLSATNRSGKDTNGGDYIQGFTNVHLNRYGFLYIGTDGFRKTDSGSNKNTKQYSNTSKITLNATSELGVNTNYITSVNKGQITNYPYRIDDNFKVSTTHGQYYQLDLENNDIVVWYALSDDKSSLFTSNATNNGLYSSIPNDARNNYYIYSKGNIMYSGVGHSSLSNDMEVKLFVNTMIAAYSTTAKDPLITITNANKSTDKDGKDYIYVNYDIYDTNEAYSSEIVTDGNTQYQRIKFRITENNILFNKKMTLSYYMLYESADALGKTTKIEIPLSTLETRKVYDDMVARSLSSGEDYYVDIPLTTLAIYNKGIDIRMKLKMTYGKVEQNELYTYKDFSLLRRDLFDLD